MNEIAEISFTKMQFIVIFITWIAFKFSTNAKDWFNFPVAVVLGVLATAGWYTTVGWVTMDLPFFPNYQILTILLGVLCIVAMFLVARVWIETLYSILIRVYRFCMRK